MKAEYPKIVRARWTEKKKTKMFNPIVNNKVNHRCDDQAYSFSQDSIPFLIHCHPPFSTFVHDFVLNFLNTLRAHHEENAYLIHIHWMSFILQNRLQFLLIMCTVKIHAKVVVIYQIAIKKIKSIKKKSSNQKVKKNCFKLILKIRNLPQKMELLLIILSNICKIMF